jgi:hypothetical protein
VRDEHDMRGEGPATPAWLGEMFRKQPEFATCMADKTLAYVFGGYPVTPSLRTSLLARFRRDEDVAALLEDALIARFLGVK